MSACAGLVTCEAAFTFNRKHSHKRDPSAPLPGGLLLSLSLLRHGTPEKKTLKLTSTAHHHSLRRHTEQIACCYLDSCRAAATANRSPASPAPQIPSLTLTRTRAKITPSPSSSSSLLCRCNGIERLWPRMLSTATSRAAHHHTHTPKSTHINTHTHTQKLNSAFAQRSSSEEGGWMLGSIASSHH